MSWFGFAASVASLLSLGISVWVALEVRSLRRLYLFQARGPHLVKTLEQHAVTVSKLILFSTVETEEIDAVLAVCSSTLNNLLPKLSGDAKKQGKRLAKRIENRVRPTGKATARELQSELLATIEAVKELRRDTFWTR